jgi:serine/threonine protein phosphatase PrpC
LKDVFDSTEIPIEIAAFSLKEPSKEKCGDGFRHAILQSENLAILCAADGVSGAAYDWKASSIACDVYMAAFKANDALGISPRIEAAVSAANEELVRQNVGKPRMLTTLVAAVWDWERDEIHYVSIGDSRMYSVTSSGLNQISADESDAVIVRGNNGKPILSAGSVAIRKGVTNVVGVPELHCIASGMPAKEIFAIILATDGFYGSAAFRGDDIIRVVKQTDLQKSLSIREIQYRDALYDDCTVVIARKKLKQTSQLFP